MDEHTFPSGDWSVDDARATTGAADLAEEILDAISRPAHDWPALSLRTSALDELVTAMALRYPRRDGPTRGG